MGWLLIILSIIFIYFYSRRKNNNLDRETEEQNNLNEEEITSSDIIFNQIEKIETPNEPGIEKNIDHKFSNTIENAEQSQVSKNILLCSDCLERHGCSQVYDLKKGCNYYRCGGSYKPEYWPKEMLGPYGKGRYKNN